jgi:predicted transcriptional regulator
MPKNLPALRDQDPKTILARYLSDESTKDIAKCYGVTRQALGQYLLKHAESEWKEAQVARAIARKEQAEDDMESIGLRIEGADKDERDRLTLTLSLARERLKAAQWDLERVCRRIYGQDVSPDQLGRISITLNIGGAGATNAVQHDVEGTVLASTTVKA